MVVRSRLRPDVPLKPAILKIYSSVIDEVFWDWNFVFKEARLRDNKIVQLGDKVLATETAVCDYMRDPVPNIHYFVNGMRNTNRDHHDWVILDLSKDPEYVYEFLIEYWSLDYVNCHICVSENKNVSGKHESHFMISRKNLFEEVHRTYWDFMKSGGWKVNDPEFGE